ncbi:MAG: ABC transporter substrate-binding protein [Alphaproteobacteria bacterium]|nr:ABC transporter substrate-binding protein [Alphaproteobacteria bacterium]
MTGKQSDGVRIGFVTTLSGGSAAIGVDMRDAFELALDHMGRTMAGKPVTVIYEDDAQNPDVGLQKTERLVQRDGVQFVAGYIWSNVLLASYRAAIDNGAFLISANAGPAELAGAQCSRDFFSTSWQNDQTPMAMGEVLTRRGADNVYVLAPNYAAGRNMVAGFKRTFRGTIAAEEYTQWPDQIDFAAELAKIRAAQPGAVWFFFPGNYGTQFFKQYAQAGLLGQIQLYSTFSIDALNLPQIGELVQGAQLTQHWGTDLDVPTNRRFVEGFRSKYGRLPSFYAAQAYDSAMLIRSAVEAVRGDVKDRDGVRAALERAAFDSVRGTFKLGRNHFPVQDFYLYEVVKSGGGAFELRQRERVYASHADPYVAECPLAR